MTNPILDRFLAVHHGLKRIPGWQELEPWLRLAGALGMADDRPGTEVAAAIDRAAYGLRTHAGWSADLAGNAQWTVAGLVTGLGLDAHRFAYEVEHLRRRLAALDLPDGGGWTAYTVGVLRLFSKGLPPSDAALAVMAGVYRDLRDRQPWLTGSEDLPAAALIAQAGMGDAALAGQIFTALGEASAWLGNSRQAAACLLASASTDARAVIARHQAVAKAMEGLRSQVAGTDPMVAALASLAQGAPEDVARTFMLAHGAISLLEPKAEPRAPTDLAAAAITLAGDPRFHQAGIEGRRLRGALVVGGAVAAIAVEMSRSVGS